jgi:ligand-binding SRPBCC domain-containing protein
MRELEETIEINASQQAVWGVLADFGGVEKWAPGIRRSSLSGKQAAGVGTRRSMRHFWGFRIDETVTEWTEGLGYTFELTRAPYPMRNVRETWRTKKLDSRTIVTTTVSYNLRLGIIGAWLDWALVRFLVSREMRVGARSLKNYSEKHTVDHEPIGPQVATLLESEAA